jgi:hypothetical protein
VNVMYIFLGYLCYSATWMETSPRPPPSFCICFPNPSTRVDSGLIVILNHHPFFTSHFSDAFPVSSPLTYVAHKYFCILHAHVPKGKHTKINEERLYSYRKEENLKRDEISYIFNHFRSLFPDRSDPFRGKGKTVGAGVGQ